MKNDLLFAENEMRGIRVADDDVFRMANARAAIARALDKIRIEEEQRGAKKAAESKEPKAEPKKEEKKIEGTKK